MTRVFAKQIDFYPRPPWGGRLQKAAEQRATAAISIHALRGEGDICINAACSKFSLISIHALRGEGDAAPLVDVV